MSRGVVAGIVTGAAMTSASLEQLHRDDGPRVVTARLNFSVPTGVKPVNKTVGPGGRLRERTGGTQDWREVRIADVRPAAAGLSLERQGFVLVEEPSAVTDFWDGQQRREVYEPEVARLVAQSVGASKVAVFDMTLRSTDHRRQHSVYAREPVQLVHNDYTHDSGPWRFADLLGTEQLDRPGRGRFCIVQVWRPISGPLLRYPLALCDASTLDPSTLIPADRVHPHRLGEIYQVQYDPAQRWFYASAMQPGEAIVFKVYDSETDGRARFTAHTAFEHPETPEDAPPRESIEIRALALFE